MDYRCQYCGRKLDTGLRCEVCDAKRGAGEVKIMTTPTKEQVKELCLHLCFNCENDFPCDGHCYKCESEHWKKYKWQVRETVKLWEKIRS